MATSELIRILRTRICARLTPQEAEFIASAAVPHDVPAGGDIGHEGETSSGLVFLLRGTAEIVKDLPGGGEDILDTVEGPVMVGEIGLLTGAPRSATMRARTRCQCYLLTRSQFERLLEGDSLAVYKLVTAMAELLAHRLTAMNHRVVAVSR